MKFKGKLQRPNQIQRFSIRKFSVGIASVVIGSFFTGSILPVSAHAQERPDISHSASAPSLATVTTSYQYVALQELTPEQRQAILTGTPSDIAQADQVYYFVYRPLEVTQPLPATGEAAPLWGAMAGALTLIVAVGLVRDRKKTIASLMVVTSLGQILATSATLAMESRLLSHYNQVFYSQLGDQLPDPRIQIDGYEYVGYFAQEKLHQLDRDPAQTSSQMSDESSVASEPETSQSSSSETSSSVASESTSNVTPIAPPSSESSQMSETPSQPDSASSESASSAVESSQSESSSSQESTSSSSAQADSSSQSQEESSQPQESSSQVSESSQPVTPPPTESSSQVPPTPNESEPSPSQDPTPAESSSETPTPQPEPQPEPQPIPLNYAQWQSQLAQAQAQWNSLAQQDLTTKTPASVGAYQAALASLEQDYQALVQVMANLQASGTISQAEIDQLAAQMQDVVSRQAGLPQQLVARADQAPLVAQVAHITALIQDLQAADVTTKTPASVQALQNQIQAAQAQLQAAQGVLANGDATEADIATMTQSLATQETSLQTARASLVDQADKTALVAALAQLGRAISTEGKTPKSIRQFEAAQAAQATHLAQVQDAAARVVADPNASQLDVDAVLADVQAAQASRDQAAGLLVDQADKQVLSQTKDALEQLLATEPDLNHKTPQSVAAYRAAQVAARQLTQEAAQLLANLDASPMEVLTLNAQLVQAQDQLRLAEAAILSIADKEALRQAQATLAQPVSTTGKTPTSVAAYEAALAEFAAEKAQAQALAAQVLADDNASQAQVAEAVAALVAVQAKQRQAIQQLVDQVDQTALRQAREALAQALAQTPDLTDKTPSSVADYQAAVAEATEALTLAQASLDNPDAYATDVEALVALIAAHHDSLRLAEMALAEQADKDELRDALAQIEPTVDTQGKTPRSMAAYEAAVADVAQQLAEAKAQAQAVLDDSDATDVQVKEALQAVLQVQNSLTLAATLLEEVTDKTDLIDAQAKLETALAATPDLSQKTPASVANYRLALQAAQAAQVAATQVLADLDASEEAVAQALAKVQEAQATLQVAQAQLQDKVDKTPLSQALAQLAQRPSLTGKTPRSQAAYQAQVQALDASIATAAAQAQAVIADDNASPAQVQAALAQVQAQQAQLDQAAQQLTNQADKAALVAAQARLAEQLANQPDLTYMTPASRTVYEAAHEAAEAMMVMVLAVIDDPDATEAEVADAVAKATTSQTHLNTATSQLQELADKDALRQAVSQATQEVDTRGKTPASVATYQAALDQDQVALDSALAQARGVLDNGNATTHQVTEALAQLQALVHKRQQAQALLVDQANKEALQQAQDALAPALVAHLDLSRKTPTSVVTYQVALQDAQAQAQAVQQLLADANASQAAVNQATQALVQAQEALEQATQALQDQADKSALQATLAQLAQPVDTQGKTPASVTAYEVARQALSNPLAVAQATAQAVVDDPNASPAEVAQAVQNLVTLGTALDQAKALLVDQADRTALIQAQALLQAVLAAEPDVTQKTPQSAAPYTAAQAAARTQLQAAQAVIADLDASPEQVAQAVQGLTEAQAALTQAQAQLQDKADKQALIQAVATMDQAVDTQGKTPKSVQAYQAQVAANQEAHEASRQAAQAVIADDNATPEAVAQALAQVQAAAQRQRQAADLLVNQADKSSLTQARTDLVTALSQVPDTTNKTPRSIANYQVAQAQAQATVEAAQAVIADLDASPEAVAAAQATVADARVKLEQAQANLTDKTDKTSLQAALNQLETPVDTMGKRPQSVRNFQDYLESKATQLAQAKVMAQATLGDDDATPEAVNQALAAVQAAQEEVAKAQEFLQDQADRTDLQVAIASLTQALAQEADVTNKTPFSVDQYRQMQANARHVLNQARQAEQDLDATPESLGAEIERIGQAQSLLQRAQGELRDQAGKETLVRLLEAVSSPIETTGKTPRSIQAYQSDYAQHRETVEAAVALGIQVEADANATEEAVKEAVNRLEEALGLRLISQSLLIDQVDKAPLEAARRRVQAALAQTPDLTGMTPDSVQNYEDAKEALETELTLLDSLIEDPNTLADEASQAQAQVQVSERAYQAAKDALTPQADKTDLRTALAQLEAPISLAGKTPQSVAAYEAERQRQAANLQASLQQARTVLADANARQADVQLALAALQARQGEVQAAQALLVNQADKTALIEAQQALTQALQDQPDVSQKTPRSVAAYEGARAQAQAQADEAVLLVADLNASPEAVAQAVRDVQAAQAQLSAAREALTDRVDTQALHQALDRLNEAATTQDKTPQSVAAYEASLAASQADRQAARQQAEAVLADPNATAQALAAAQMAVQAAQAQQDQARSLLVQQADKSHLQQAIQTLQDALAQQPDLGDKTPKTRAAYEAARRQATDALAQAQALAQDLNASPEAVSAAQDTLAQAQRQLADSQAALQVKGDKTALTQALATLTQPISTVGKTPRSVAAYQDQRQADQADFDQAQTQAQAVLANEEASPADVAQALATVAQAQAQVQAAQALLIDQADKTDVTQAHAMLEAALQQTPDLADKTPQSVAQYEAAKREANRQLQLSQALVADLDATPSTVRAQAQALRQAQEALVAAQAALKQKANKADLTQALATLNQVVDTHGKTPQSVQAYTTQLNQVRAGIEAAKAQAQAVLADENVSPAQVAQTLAAVQTAQAELAAAQALLEDQADKSALIQARADLQAILQEVSDENNKTPRSLAAYQSAKEAAQARVVEAQTLVEDLDASPSEVAQAVTALQAAQVQLQATRQALTGKANKDSLRQALTTLQQPITTTGKTPRSIQALTQAQAADQGDYDQAVQVAQSVIQDDNATPEMVNQALAAVQAAQAKVNDAKALLVDQADKSVLRHVKDSLDDAIQAQPSLLNKTPQSVTTYQEAVRQAQAQTQAAQAVIDDLDASPAQVQAAQAQVQAAKDALTRAQDGLMDKANKEGLSQALETLRQPINSTGKTPKSVQAFNQAQVAAQAEVTAAVDNAQRVMADENASPEAVNQALEALQAAQTQVNAAKALLVDQADKTALTHAKDELTTLSQANPDLSNKTPRSVARYQDALAAAQEQLVAAQRLIDDLDASPAQVQAAESALAQAKQTLALAQDGLTAKANKDGLNQALATLNQPTTTTGKTPNSVRDFQQALATHQATVDQAKTQAQAALSDENASPEAVNQALLAVQAAQEKVDAARALLVDQADKSALNRVQSQLTAATQATVDLSNKTPQSVSDYQAALQAAQETLNQAQAVAEDSNATPAQVAQAQARVVQAQSTLAQAQANLKDKANKAGLVQALATLQAPIVTEGKTPQSIATFQADFDAHQAERNQAVQQAQALIADENASPSQVAQALEAVQAAQAQVNQAQARLVDQADKTALKQAQATLTSELSPVADLTNKTPKSVQAYEAAKQAAQAQVTAAQVVIDDANATPQAVAVAVQAVKEAQAQLAQAQAGLTDKANKDNLIQALATLNQPISTAGKTPNSIQAYEDSQATSQVQIADARAQATQVIADQDATPDQVNSALAKVQAAQVHVNQAQALLVDQADKTVLTQAQAALTSDLSQAPDLTNKTPKSTQAYEVAKQAAGAQVTAAQTVIDDANATPQAVAAAVQAVKEAQAQLAQAQAGLTDKANKDSLIQALATLNQSISTDGKTPNSIQAYEASQATHQSQVDQAKAEATRVIKDLDATPEQVNHALQTIQAAQAQVNQAKALLVDQADKSALTQAKAALDAQVATQPNLANKTPNSLAAYQAARAEATRQSDVAQAILADLNATPADVQATQIQVIAAQSRLAQAQAGLTDKADKAALVQALTALNQPIATTGKTPNSIRSFDQRQAADQASINQAKAQAQAVIQDDNASVAQVNQALQVVQAAQDKVEAAKALLVSQADKTALIQSTSQMDSALQAKPNLVNKTPNSVAAYEMAKTNAQEALASAQAILQDLNATPTEVAAAQARLAQMQATLVAAEAGLTDKVDKTALTQALATLNQAVVTTNKTPKSIQAYQDHLKANDGVITPAKTTAAQVIADDNATKAQVDEALRALQAAQAQVNQATALLVNQANKSILPLAISNVQRDVAQVPDLTDKTPRTVAAYESAKVAAEEAIKAAQTVQADPNVTQAEVKAAIDRLTAVQRTLRTSKTALQVKGDKAALQAAYDTLNTPIVTTGKTPKSIEAYQKQASTYETELNAAKQQAQAVLADDNATATQVATALQAVQAVQPKIDEAQKLLVNQANKYWLPRARTNVRNAVNQVPNLTNRTPASLDTYQKAKEAANAALDAALVVEQDPNASQAEVTVAIQRLTATLNALNAAKTGLQNKADKTALQAAYNALNAPVDTTGKTPASVTAYSSSLAGNQAGINQAKTQAQTILADENATQTQVAAALQTVQAAQAKVDEAKAKLVDQANKQALKASIEATRPLVEAHYTPASWQALQTQLAKAKQVDQDQNASQQAVDTAQQALDRAVAQLVTQTPHFTAQEVVKSADEFQRSVVVNYTLSDPAKQYRSAQVKVYHGNQLVQTVAIKNNQAEITGLNYEVPYRLVTELTYTDKSGSVKTEPQLTEETVELKLKKLELKQITEEGLYQVAGTQLRRISALDTVPQDLSQYLVKVSSDRFKDVTLQVQAIQEVTHQGQAYYQVTATAPELVQNNGGTTDYHQSHQFLVRKAVPAVNNVYYTFGELLTAMKANLSGTFTLGANMSAADVMLDPGQVAYVTDTFRGKLLGQGTDGKAYAIFDLKAPLFKETDGATITDLDLKRVDIRDRNNVGSLATTVTKSTITNVTASGRLSGDHNIGGLVSQVKNGSQLTQVGFKGKIEAMGFSGTATNVGGIAANLENGRIYRALADVEMYVSSSNENAKFGGLVGTVAQAGILTNAVVKGSIYNSGSNVLRRFGSSTGGAVGSNYWLGRIDQIISEVKVENGRIFYGHTFTEGNKPARDKITNIAVVDGVSSGIAQDFITNLETLTPAAAAQRQKAMGITVSFDDTADVVTTVSQDALRTDYSLMPNYQAAKQQAYLNIEKLLPFYNKEQIIKYGNLVSPGSKLATQSLLAISPMQGSSFVTDYSQPMDRIMLHFADKSVQYLGLSNKTAFKNTGIIEYQLEDSGLIYTPNQIQQASVDRLAQEIAAQLGTVDLQSDKVLEVLGLKTKTYLDAKAQTARKADLQKRLGRVPTDAEVKADLEAANQAERIKDMKRLYLEETLESLKPQLAREVAKILKQSLNQVGEGGQAALEASLKQTALESKEALLLGLLYMQRHYQVAYGDLNIGELATYQADFFGQSGSVLDQLIYLGGRGYNGLHSKNNVNAYGAFVRGNQAPAHLLDYLDYFRETLTQMDENTWFRQATQKNLVLEERGSKEEGLAKNEYHLYPRLKNRTLQNYILPLLNLKDSTLFAVSTVNGFTWGSLDRRNYNRAKLEELVKLMADRQQVHLDTWYRVALPEVRDRLAHNPGQQTWDGYKDPTGQWYGEFGENNAKGNGVKKPSMAIREFFGPIGRYFGSSGAAAFADTTSNIYFIHTDMLDGYNGASIWTHELIHNQDKTINLGGYGWRPGQAFEQYPQGLLQAPEGPNRAHGRPMNHMAMNTAFDYSKETLRYYNESPDRFQTAADMQEYVHGVFDVLYMLDYAEGENVIARGKDFWKKMYHQVVNKADGKHALNVIKELTDAEWDAIKLTSVDDLIANQLIVKRGSVAGTTYNRDNYVTVHMFAPNYATGENSSGSTGGLMFKRMAWELLAYKGYEDGFIPYASDKLQKEAKAAGHDELSDTYVIQSVSGGQFQNMTAFKQAMFKERVDKLNQQLIPITVNGTQVRTYADIQKLLNQAMEADIKANRLGVAENNLHLVKKEIYRQYLLATNDFRTSIFQGQ